MYDNIGSIIPLNIKTLYTCSDSYSSLLIFNHLIVWITILAIFDCTLLSNVEYLRNLASDIKWKKVFVEKQIYLT